MTDQPPHRTADDPDHASLEPALPSAPPATAHGERVLLLSSLPKAWAAHVDAMEESGYSVELLAPRWPLPAEISAPDLVILDAPEPRQLELLSRLRVESSLPVIVLCLAGVEGMVEGAMAAGASDCLLAPVRPRELLQRMSALLRRASDRPRSALDAFGHASIAVRESDGWCLWQTALARSLMAEFFSGGHFERGRLPPELLLWLHREALRRRAGAEPGELTVLAQWRASRGRSPRPSAAALVARSERRLSFTLHEADPEALGEGQWLIVLHEAAEERPGR
ncbi:hypothetical protein [Pelomonas sp. SE-A7]|uniref:hypothetical protein n=1 Tax=Pelomonas sp. SE-A7 TaxID=3054953 RepID=UPI00259CF929|nr:hypothetical protein [Pelomonas sp. SE-A7]MDM4766224.1 hypothetical protein [Pelomonas sp. SE-A7]